MNEQVEAVNKIIRAGEPGNISVDEHSNYTGYKPQAIIDAMNEVLWGKWGFEEVSSEIVPGDKGALAVAQVKVCLNDITFCPVAWGQNRVTRGDIGDARKGAQTDAIKKALSYFSIGNRAYHGLLDAKKPGDQQSHANGNGNKPADAKVSQDQEKLNECKRLAKDKGIAATGADWLKWLEAQFKQPTTDADLLASPVKLTTIRGELIRAK